MRRENWLSMSYQKCFMFSLKLSILYVLNKSGGGKKVWMTYVSRVHFFAQRIIVPRLQYTMQLQFLTSNLWQLFH